MCMFIGSFVSCTSYLQRDRFLDAYVHFSYKNQPKTKTNPPTAHPIRRFFSGGFYCCASRGRSGRWGRWTSWCPEMPWSPELPYRSAGEKGVEVLFLLFSKRSLCFFVVGLWGTQKPWSAWPIEEEERGLLYRVKKKKQEDKRLRHHEEEVDEVLWLTGELGTKLGVLRPVFFCGERPRKQEAPKVEFCFPVRWKYTEILKSPVINRSISGNPEGFQKATKNKTPWLVDGAKTSGSPRAPDQTPTTRPLLCGHANRAGVQMALPLARARVETPRSRCKGNKKTTA